MKLTNNLSKEQSFNAYPFTLLHEYRSRHDSIYEGDVRIFKRAHLEGFQVQEMLVRLHEAAKEDESINIYENIDFFSDIYANHWPHRHELPDPSHAIPIDLSSARLERVINVYKVGIDASFFATNDMPVSYMSSLSKWLVESALEMKNWNRHALKQIKLTFE